MKLLYAANDWHFAAMRAGGTTPITAWALRLSLLKNGEQLLEKIDGDLVFNGDLFDSHQVANYDLLAAVRVFSSWFKKGHHLYLARANHDISKNTTILSSFDLFAAILSNLFPSQTTVITEATAVPEHNAYVIPHLANQVLFDEALKTVPKCRLLFVHANYDNHFAVESDHSLNMSPEQAQKLPVDNIIFGHEHQRRSELGGKVVIVGNQFPTSVADCLGNDAKYMLRIDSKLEHLPVWEAAEDFARPDWRELKTFQTTARFIRVEGDAASGEMSEVVAAISKFRSKSEAFIVTNAVKIDGVATDDEVQLTLESLKAFDVYAELLELLSDEEQTTIKELVEKHDVQTRQAA